MIVEVIRDEFLDKSTLGKMYIDGVFICDTLEDKVRPKKIRGETAIPTGTYQLILNQSVRFKKLLPLLLNVPNFEGVRIHSGNTEVDTEGCILVGIKNGYGVKDSRITMTKVMSLLKQSKNITIVVK